MLNVSLNIGRMVPYVASCLEKLFFWGVFCFLYLVLGNDVTVCGGSPTGSFHSFTRSFSFPHQATSQSFQIFAGDSFLSIGISYPSSSLSSPGVFQLFPSPCQADL